MFLGLNKDLNSLFYADQLIVGLILGDIFDNISSDLCNLMLCAFKYFDVCRFSNLCILLHCAFSYFLQLFIAGKPLQVKCISENTTCIRHGFSSV